MSTLPVKKRRTYIYHNPSNGFIETIDSDTGNVLLIQRSLKDIDSIKDRDQLISYSMDGHQTMIEKSLVASGPQVVQRWVFNEVVASMICQRIQEGETLLDICKPHAGTVNQKILPPYFVVAQWRRDHPEFDEQVKQSFKDRAEIFHGHALRQAELTDEDNASAQKVLVDTYKWAAGIDDAERFGTKTKISGDAENPITFVINTGIPRPNDANYIEPKQALPVIDVTPKDEESNGS